MTDARRACGEKIIRDVLQKDAPKVAGGMEIAITGAQKDELVAAIRTALQAEKFLPAQFTAKTETEVNAAIEGGLFERGWRGDDHSVAENVGYFAQRIYSRLEEFFLPESK